MLSRSRKAIYNIVAMVAYEVTTTICGFILPRLILSNYGSTLNGTISSITQFISFISLLTLGIAGATRVELYKSLAADDIRKTSGIIKSHEQFMHKVSYVLVGYICVLSIAFPIITDSSILPLGVSALVIIIGFGIFAQYFFGITYNTLLTADQRGYIYYIIQCITTVLNTIVGYTLIKIGASIYIVKLGSSLLFFLSPLIMQIYVRRKYKLLSYIKADNSALKQRSSVMASSIANTVHSNVDITVLTFFSELKIISIYSVYSLVVNSLLKIFQVFATGLEAAFGNMFAKGEYEAMNRNLDLFEYFVCAFISIIFACAAILILPFIKLYTTGVTDVEYILPIYAALALTAMAVQCFREPYLTIVQAAGKYKETKNGAIAEACINIVLSTVGVICFGLIGVIIGTLVANLFRTIQYVFFVSKKLLARKIYPVLLKIIWIIFNITLITLISKFIIPFVNYTTWLNWFINAITIFILSSLIVMISSFTFFKSQTIQLLQILLRKSFSKEKLT